MTYYRHKDIKKVLAPVLPSQKATYGDFEFLRGATFWAVRHTPSGHVVLKEKPDYRPAFLSCLAWVKTNYKPE